MSLLLLFNGAPIDPGPVVPTVSAPDSNVFIAHGNLIDVSMLSGGSWVSTLPLANLKNRTLARVARTTGIATSATQFVIDVGANKSWRVLSLINHNLSLDARYRVRAGGDPTFAAYDYDSGWQDVWPAVYDEEELEWDDLNWWEGTYSEDERQGYNWTLIHKLPSALLARYAWVEIDDPFNVSSFVQLGRVFIAPGWTPSHNMSVGATLGWEDESDIQQAYGGAEFFNEQPRYRIARFTIQNIDNDEAYGKAFEIFRQAGRTGEVLLQWSGTDTKHAIRRSFVGRLRQLSPIEHPYSIHDNAAFEIKEST